MGDDRASSSSEILRSPNISSPSRDVVETLSHFLGIRQCVGHPETFQKHVLLLEYLSDVHDSSKSHYFTTRIPASRFLEAYSTTSNKKKSATWFNLGYNLGSLLGTVDIVKFSRLFNNLLNDLDLEWQDRASARKLLTVPPSWSIKRASRSITTSDSLPQSVASAKSFGQTLTMNEMVTILSSPHCC